MMSYEHELTHEQEDEYSEFKAEISVKYESVAKACRGRRTEHTPSAGGRPRRSETTTLIASSAVSNSPGVAPVGRRVRTRVEGVCDNSCLPRSPPTSANFSADALDTYFYTYPIFIDALPYQNQHEMTNIRNSRRPPAIEIRSAGVISERSVKVTTPSGEMHRYAPTMSIQNEIKALSTLNGGENSHEQPEPAEASRVSSEARRASVA